MKIKNIKTENKKRIAVRAVLLTMPALCAVVMTGCQWTPFGMTTNAEGVGKEKLITEAVTKISNAQSMDADIDANMTAKAEISGFGVGVDAATDMNVKSAKANNASHTKGNVAFEFFGENGSVDIETYSYDRDDIRYTYMNESNALTGDTGWIVTKHDKNNRVSSGRSVNTKSLNSAGIINIVDNRSDNSMRLGSSGSNDGSNDAYKHITLGDLLGLYSAAKDSMADLTIKDGTKTIEGKECYVVEGPLKGENVKTLTDGLGFSIPGLPGLPQPDLSEIDADISLYFEKESREPYVVELRIPNVSGKADGSSVVFGIENLDAKIKFNSFDANNEITVPEDVVNSAVINVDTDEIQNLLNGKK